MHLSDILFHLAEDRENYYNAVSPPVIQSSNFAFKDLETFRKIFPNEMERYIVLSGPSFADDMFKKSPTLVLLSGKNKEKVQE